MGAIEVSSTGGSAQTLAAREFSPAEMDVIKSVIAKGATDVELKMFVAMAQKLGLDPLSKQIHCVKRRAKLADGSYGEAMTITVGIDGYRLVADRTGRYCPGRAPTYTYDAHDRIESATAYVLKLAGGVWHEVSAVAFWDEYAQTNRDGQPTAMWAKMPRLMLGKCAEALALRRAFPAELSGVYTEDEMAQASSEPAPRVSVDAHAPIDADLVQRPAIAAPSRLLAETHDLVSRAQHALESDMPQHARDALVIGLDHARVAIDAKNQDAMRLACDELRRLVPPIPGVQIPAAPAWKTEMIELGKRARSIIDTVADLPDDQREQLTQAMALAREALTANGHGTPEQRAAAVAALKQAIGVKEEA